MRLLIRSIVSPLSGGYCSSFGRALQLLRQRVGVCHRFVADITAAHVGSRLVVNQRAIVQQFDHLALTWGSTREHERWNVVGSDRRLQSMEVGALTRTDECDFNGAVQLHVGGTKQMPERSRKA